MKTVAQKSVTSTVILILFLCIPVLSFGKNVFTGVKNVSGGRLRFSFSYEDDVRWYFDKGLYQEKGSGEATFSNGIRSLSYTLIDDSGEIVVQKDYKNLSSSEITVRWEDIFCKESTFDKEGKFCKEITYDKDRDGYDHYSISWVALAEDGSTFEFEPGIIRATPGYKFRTTILLADETTARVIDVPNTLLNTFEHTLVGRYGNLVIPGIEIDVYPDLFLDEAYGDASTPGYINDIEIFWAQANSDVNSLTQNLLDAKIELADVLKELSVAKVALLQCQEKLEKVKIEKALLENEIGKLSDENANLEYQLGEANAYIGELKLELAANVDAINQLKVKLANAFKQIEERDKLLAKANIQIKALQASLDKANAQIASYVFDINQGFAGLDEIQALLGAPIGLRDSESDYEGRLGDSLDAIILNLTSPGIPGDGNGKNNR